MSLMDAVDEVRSEPKTSVAPPPLPTIEVLGVSVANESQMAIVDWIVTRIASDTRTCIYYLNAHCSNVAATDPDYREALSKADVILPDGCGVDLSARLHGKRLASKRSNCTDLIPRVCQRLADVGGSVYLLGGQPGIADAAAKNLLNSFPGLRVAGTHHGYFHESQEGELIQSINRSGAQLLLVAMGVPHQELWLSRVNPFLNPTVALGVGGLLDFLSGRIPRAPAVLRATGLEWFYRLCQEPRRMWRRYLFGNPRFVARTLAAVVRARMATGLRELDPTGKRTLDVCGASMGLLLLLFPMLLVALAIRLTSPGPAIFRQRRVGKDGKFFTLYKFRSMYLDAPAWFPKLSEMNHHGSNSVTFKMVRDPRVTPIGRWLRRSSADELPQLWNVLIGDMSLVGPRPPIPSEVMRYTEEQQRRLYVRPGLTGLWQVSGRADLPFAQQVQLDLHYIEHRNLLMDFRILLKTVRVVVSARGAY